MQTLLVDRAVSMSGFKKNPAAVLRQAQGRPVAVLNHNRVGFYLLEPRLFEVLLAELARLAPDGDRGASGPARSPARLIEDLLSQAKAQAPGFGTITP
jgi:PHD/YefM family antitoxin component YafN of YafNO toxin-antitoxin module